MADLDRQEREQEREDDSLKKMLSVPIARPFRIPMLAFLSSGLLVLAAIAWSLIEYSGESERNVAAITIVITPDGSRSSP